MSQCFAPDDEMFGYETPQYKQKGIFLIKSVHLRLMVGLGPTGGSDNPDNPFFMFVCRTWVTVQKTSRGNWRVQSGLSKTGSRGKLKYIYPGICCKPLDHSVIWRISAWSCFLLFYVCWLLTSVEVDVDGWDHYLRVQLWQKQFFFQLITQMWEHLRKCFPCNFCLFKLFCSKGSQSIYQNNVNLFRVVCGIGGLSLVGEKLS